MIEGGELQGIASVDIASPDLMGSRAHGRKYKLALVGRELGRIITSSSGKKNSSLRSDPSIGMGKVDAPDRRGPTPHK
jgi:hypothetical protein